MNKKIVILLVFIIFGLIANSQIVGVVANQQYKFDKHKPDVVPTKTRFIIVGASIMAATFYDPINMKSRIENEYPNADVTIHNHASPGETIGSYATGSVPNITNTLSLYNNYNSDIKTYVVVHLGGNDRTNSGAWTSLTNTKKNQLRNDLDFILDAIIAKGFTPILNDLGFRNYDKLAHDDEEYGVKTYNDSLIIPRIKEYSPQFSFSDGQSFWQLYTLIYNNYEDYLSSDDIHPSGTGYAAMRTAFVNTICKYIFTGVPPAKIIKNGSIPAHPPLDNMYDEDEYLNAYIYPLSSYSLSSLQTAIDTYDVIRFEAGTYGNSSQTLYVGSNKKLFGVPNETTLPKLVLREGTENTLISGLRGAGSINFEVGAPIKNNTIKNYKNSQVINQGASIENNTFINITGAFNWDNSASGYARNNTIIRHWIHASSPQITFKGNTTTPSYGNLQIWLNNLTPNTDGNIIDGFETVTIIGHDSEGWNLNGTGTKAMTEIKNSGTIRITDFGGGNGYSPVKTPPFDIEAENLYLFNANLNNSDDSNRSKVITETNVYMLNGTSRYDFESDGFNLNLGRASTAAYNGTNLNSTLSSGTTLDNITAALLTEEKEPIDRPLFDPIPNPTGENWKTEREGKTDSKDYIQGLINSNGVAVLPEGIYCIGASLMLEQNQGVVGAGTGKTVIVGLTDDFALINFIGTGTNRVWSLRNITLQGGHTGLKVEPSEGQMMVTGLVMNDVVFRDQTYGIHLNKFFGLDNNFFENINFVSCEIGLYQERNPDSNTTQSDIMYLDKNVFYRSQFINCGTAFSLIAGRPNNLNMWVDCLFDGNEKAIDMFYNNYSSFVNCDFKNHTGEYVIGRAPSISLYNCEFEGNSTTSIFKTTTLTMEGCTISDNVPLLVNVAFNPVNAYIQNSIVTGTLGTLGTYGNGIIANSSMLGNPELNKLLVKIVSGTATTLIDETPTPYPQFLVKHE